MRFGWVLLLTVCYFIVGSTTSLPNVSADEITVKDNTPHTIGDFACSSLPEDGSSQLALNGESFAAGELWKFFSEGGRSSLNSMTLLVDRSALKSDCSVDVRAVELKIPDPDNPGHFLTSVSLGDNVMLVPGDSLLSNKTKLEFELGYDFMKTFSADSQEMVIVKFETEDSDESAAPALFIQSRTMGFFSQARNPICLAAFVVFWVVVFNLLNRFTKPADETAEPANGNAPESVLVNAQTENAMSA